MTSKLTTCFIDGFTSKMKSQSIVYLLNGSGHIYWILDLEMKCTQYGLYGQAAFKDARGILFSKVGQSGLYLGNGGGMLGSGAQPWANMI